MPRSRQARGRAVQRQQQAAHLQPAASKPGEYRRSGQKGKTGKVRVQASSWPPEHLRLPPCCAITAGDKVAFVLKGLLSPSECAAWIDRSHATPGGYRSATIQSRSGNGGGRGKLNTTVRSSLRCMMDGVETASDLFGRIRSHLPQLVEGRRLAGLNERLRFLRYEQSGHFAPHHDGEYTRPDGSERSNLTIMVYLNSGGGVDFEGGETRFLSMADKAAGVNHTPEIGDVLVFSHDLYHAGCEVTCGVKYAVRTDVMYEARVATKHAKHAKHSSY